MDTSNTDQALLEVIEEIQIDYRKNRAFGGVLAGLAIGFTLIALNGILNLLHLPGPSWIPLMSLSLLAAPMIGAACGYLWPVPVRHIVEEADRRAELEERLLTVYEYTARDPHNPLLNLLKKDAIRGSQIVWGTDLFSDDWKPVLKWTAISAGLAIIVLALSLVSPPEGFIPRQETVREDMGETGRRLEDLGEELTREMLLEDSSELSQLGMEMTQLGRSMQEFDGDDSEIRERYEALKQDLMAHIEQHREALQQRMQRADRGDNGEDGTGDGEDRPGGEGQEGAGTETQEQQLSRLEEALEEMESMDPDTPHEELEGYYFGDEEGFDRPDGDHETMTLFREGEEDLADDHDGQVTGPDTRDIDDDERPEPDSTAPDDDAFDQDPFAIEGHRETQDYIETYLRDLLPPEADYDDDDLEERLIVYREELMNLLVRERLPATHRALIRDYFILIAEE